MLYRMFFLLCTILLASIPLCQQVDHRGGSHVPPPLFGQRLCYISFYRFNVSGSSTGFCAAMTSFRVIAVDLFLTLESRSSKSSSAPIVTALAWSPWASMACCSSARFSSTVLSLNVKCRGILNRLCKSPNRLVAKNVSSMDCSCCG